MQEIFPSKGEDIIESISYEELIQSWSKYLATEYTEATRTAYLKGMRLFQNWLLENGCSLAEVAPRRIRDWREHLKGQYSSQTVNLWLSSIRRFYAFLIEEYNAPILNPGTMVRGASRRGKYKQHKRDELTGSEVLAVIATCDSSLIGIRDKALISLMAYCALRTIEIQRADLNNLQTKGGRGILWIRGKGHEDSDEFVVLPKAADSALREWISERGGEPGPLFISLSRQNAGERLSTRAIRGIVKSKFHEAGIHNNNKTTHSLRHSAILNAIRNGATPLQVQAMARHSSFDTTLIYYHEIGRLKNPAEDLISY